MDEVTAYKDDYKRYARYLLQFMEAYPSFVYWSNEEPEGEDAMKLEKSSKQDEGVGA